MMKYALYLFILTIVLILFFSFGVGVAPWDTLASLSAAATLIAGIIAFAKKKEMRAPTSITGWVLVIIFALISAYYIYDAQTCRGFLCGLTMIIPIFPWALVVDWASRSEWLFWTFYVVSLLINATILYLIGAGIAKLVSRGKSAAQHQPPSIPT
jgi:hypothetical protein